MSVGLLFRLGLWERLPEGEELPESVERETEQLREVYSEVHDDVPDGEEVVVEYGDLRYKVVFHDDGGEVGRRVYRSPNVARSVRFGRWLVGVASDPRGALAGIKRERVAFAAGIWAIAMVVALYLAVGALGPVTGASAGVLPFVGEEPTRVDSNITGPTSSPESFGMFVFDPAETERLILEETNSERLSEGVGRVNYSADLSEIAAEHASNMAENDYVGHTTPSGETSAERYSGVCGDGSGENAASTLYKEEFESPVTGDDTRLLNETDVARFFVDAWMDSAPHRRTMLYDGWDSTGVGVVLRDDGKLFAVQAFC